MEALLDLEIPAMEPLSDGELEQMFQRWCEERGRCWTCGTQAGARPNVFALDEPRCCGYCWEPL